jgi:hypothetical protein
MKEIFEQLNSQRHELYTLITIEAVAGIHQKDLGRLNNLQRALKLNQNITKLLKNENK